MSSNPASGEARVAVVGFGYIGCCIGACLADRGYPVDGVDPSARIRDAVNDGRSPFNETGLEERIRRGRDAGLLRATDDYSVVADADVVVITVGTPLSDSGDADLGQIRSAVGSVAPYVKDGQLVVLKSTVPPHTTSGVVAPILREKADVKIAFCPERLAEGRAIEELFSIPVVVGGIDAASTEAACAFWQTALDVEVQQVRNSLSAELVKLADNLWIDLNIALANELALLADKLGDIDILEVITAANSLPKGQHNVNILIPSMGVGGYCLTKDPWFVHGMGRKVGLDLKTPVASRSVNDGMPDYTASLIDDALLTDGRQASDCKVAVLGLAFKNQTGDVRYTPTKPAIDALRKRGYQLSFHDPWVTEEDATSVAGTAPTPDIASCVEGADCVAFLAGHKDFHDFPIERIAELARPGALVVDGRIFFGRDKIAQIEALGLRYKGIGR